jgi:GT2 family glycosyltransferase
MIAAPHEQMLKKGELIYEVVVTDDGSQSTAEALVQKKFPWARWFPGPRRGPAANRNFGAIKATGEWLLFLDDDCVPVGGWLEAYAAATINSPNISVFEGRTVPQGLQTRADQECPSNLQGGHLWSCNFAIKRRLFLDLQGFDEQFPLAGMEDIDLQVRLEKMGCPILFVPGACVEHPWRSRKGPGFYIMLAKSIGYFATKHSDSKPIFSESWAIKRALRAIAIEFPRNFIHFRDGSPFRVLYLELVAASTSFFELLSKRARPMKPR